MKNLLFECRAQAPSNIAFVKYWGKKQQQTPINPSLSMTLNHAHTQTQLKVFPAQSLEVELVLSDERNTAFEKRVLEYITQLSIDYPELKGKSYKVDTRNSFAHSTGIASSASGFAALALCLHKFLSSKGITVETASSLARRGSGSAARSFDGPYTVWGESSELEGSSDFTAMKIREGKLEKLADTIVIVDPNPKKLSSSQGHALMADHPYKQHRIENANRRLQQSLKAIKNGDFSKLGELIEQEALELHGLMMTGRSPFWLMSAQTIDVMNWLLKQREDGIEAYFTLDAGANVHLISKIDEQNELVKRLREDFPKYELLIDQQGTGAKIL